LLWEKVYNSGRNDEALAVAIDANGDVVVTGSSGTFKYAAEDGTLRWEQPYSSAMRSTDGDGKALALDLSGNVGVTGYTYNGTNGDYYIAKYAAVDGMLIWENRFNGPSNANDYAQSVAMDGGGNVIVTGFSDDALNCDFTTIKYAAADGALLWLYSYNGPGNGRDEGYAVTVDPLGNPIVAGSSHNGTNADYYTASYAATDGALLWEKRYDSGARGNDLIGTAHSLALGPDGSVAIAGSSGHTDSRFGGVVYDYATVVYATVIDRVTLSISLVPEGVRISFTGPPNHVFDLERAPSIEGPWETIKTVTISPENPNDFIDTNPLPDSAFYRTKSP